MWNKHHNQRRQQQHSHTKKKEGNNNNNNNNNNNKESRWNKESSWELWKQEQHQQEEQQQQLRSHKNKNNHNSNHNHNHIHTYDIDNVTEIKDSNNSRNNNNTVEGREENHRATGRHPATRQKEAAVDHPPHKPPSWIVAQFQQYLARCFDEEEEDNANANVYDDDDDPWRRRREGMAAPSSSSARFTTKTNIMTTKELSSASSSFSLIHKWDNVYEHLPIIDITTLHKTTSNSTRSTNPAPFYDSPQVQYREGSKFTSFFVPEAFSSSGKHNNMATSVHPSISSTSASKSLFSPTITTEEFILSTTTNNDNTTNIIPPDRPRCSFEAFSTDGSSQPATVLFSEIITGNDNLCCDGKHNGTTTQTNPTRPSFTENNAPYQNDIEEEEEATQQQQQQQQQPNPPVATKQNTVQNDAATSISTTSNSTTTVLDDWEDIFGDDGSVMSSSRSILLHPQQGKVDSVANTQDYKTSCGSATVEDNKGPTTRAPNILLDCSEREKLHQPIILPPPGFYQTSTDPDCDLSASSSSSSLSITNNSVMIPPPPGFGNANIEKKIRTVVHDAAPGCFPATATSTTTERVAEDSINDAAVSAAETRKHTRLHADTSTAILGCSIERNNFQFNHNTTKNDSVWNIDETTNATKIGDDSDSIPTVPLPPSKDDATAKDDDSSATPADWEARITDDEEDERVPTTAAAVAVNHVCVDGNEGRLRRNIIGTNIFTVVGSKNNSETTTNENKAISSTKLLNHSVVDDDSDTPEHWEELLSDDEINSAPKKGAENNNDETEFESEIRNENETASTNKMRVLVVDDDSETPEDWEELITDDEESALTAPTSIDDDNDDDDGDDDLHLTRENLQRNALTAAFVVESKSRTSGKRNLNKTESLNTSIAVPTVAFDEPLHEGIVTNVAAPALDTGTAQLVSNEFAIVKKLNKSKNTETHLQGDNHDNSRSPEVNFDSVWDMGSQGNEKVVPLNDVTTQLVSNTIAILGESDTPDNWEALFEDDESVKVPTATFPQVSVDTLPQVSFGGRVQGTAMLPASQQSQASLRNTKTKNTKNMPNKSTVIPVIIKRSQIEITPKQQYDSAWDMDCNEDKIVSSVFIPVPDDGRAISKEETEIDDIDAPEDWETLLEDEDESIILTKN